MAEVALVKNDLLALVIFELLPFATMRPTAPTDSSDKLMITSSPHSIHVRPCLLFPRQILRGPTGHTLASHRDLLRYGLAEEGNFFIIPTENCNDCKLLSNIECHGFLLLWFNAYDSRTRLPLVWTTAILGALPVPSNFKSCSRVCAGKAANPWKRHIRRDKFSGLVKTVSRCCSQHL